MTQAKDSKKGCKKPTANKLQKQFLCLSNDEQVGVTTFFNLHNAAHFVYDKLSDAGKDYVNYCIRLSQQADKIESENSAQIS